MNLFAAMVELCGPRKGRRLWVLSGVVLAVALLLLCFAFVSGVLARMRAEHLWRDIQTLNLETSTLADVQKLAEHYGGEHRVTGTLLQPDAFACTSSHCEYLVITQHWYGDRLAYANPCSRFHRWILRPLNASGLRPWQLVIQLDVDEGRLSGMGSSLAIRREDGFRLEGITEVNRKMPTRVGTQPYFVDYTHVSTTGNGEGLVARVTPAATQEQFRRAYDIKFNCLTKAKACSLLSDLMPSAWSDFVESQGSGRMPTSGGPWDCK
jgi:hypothetical protein